MNNQNSINTPIIEELACQVALASLFATTDHTNHIITVDLIHTDWHKSESGTPENSIKCVEHYTKKVIGWISQSPTLKIQNQQMTGFIHRNSKNGYYVLLDTQNIPTAREYAIAKNYCMTHNLSMPAYDIRAYTDIFRKKNECKRNIPKNSQNLKTKN